MNTRPENRWTSWGSGVIVPLLGCAYGGYILCCKRRTKGGIPMSDEDAFWFAIPVLGLALFFHAWYFHLYSKRKWLRAALMLMAISIMAYGVACVFVPAIRPQK
jgi:hypothetical protein